MAIPYRIKSLEEIDEELRTKPLAEFFVENGDGFQLDLDGLPDVAGLNTALSKERKRVKELSAEVNSWKELGPLEDMKNLRAKAEDIEKSHATSKGKVDELLVKQQREFESKIQPLQEQLKLLENERNQAILEKKKWKIEKALEDEFRKLKGKAAYLDDVKLRAEMFDEFPELGVAMRDGDGDVRRTADGKPLTAELFLKMAEKDKPDWFEGSSGGGSQGGTRRGAAFKAVDRDNPAEVLANLEALARGEVSLSSPTQQR